MIRPDFESKIKHATTLQEIAPHALVHLRHLKEQDPHHKLAYVSGIISSDGPEFIDRNMQNLRSHTDRLRKAHQMPVFSATDIFTDAINRRINSTEIPVGDWLSFWKDILTDAGVTDIYMTPRWEYSTGARDELRVARNLGLDVHYYEPHHKVENPFQGRSILLAKSISNDQDRQYIGLRNYILRHGGSPMLVMPDMRRDGKEKRYFKPNNFSGTVVLTGEQEATDTFRYVSGPDLPKPVLVLSRKEPGFNLYKTGQRGIETASHEGDLQRAKELVHEFVTAQTPTDSMIGFRRR